jgi:hypothetical protein
VISLPLNAGIGDNLKLGDSYSKVYEYYGNDPEPRCGKPRQLREEYRYNGIRYVVNSDSTNRENYSKIIRIAIDKMTKY